MKNMKALTATILTTVIALGSVGVFFGCNSAAANNTQPSTQAVTETTAATEAATAKTASETASKSDSNISATSKTSGTVIGKDSPVYKKLASLVSKKGVTGYTCCKIQGSDSYFLVAHYGTVEAERTYKFYEITADSANYVGDIGGSHTVPYIDKDTATLGLMDAHMGNWQYGLVDISKGLTCNYDHQGAVKANEDYPKLHGEKIELTDPSNTDQLQNF